MDDHGWHNWAVLCTWIWELKPQSLVLSHSKSKSIFEMLNCYSDVGDNVKLENILATLYRNVDDFFNIKNRRHLKVVTNIKRLIHLCSRSIPI